MPAEGVLVARGHIHANPLNLDLAIDVLRADGLSVRRDADGLWWVRP